MDFLTDIEFKFETVRSGSPIERESVIELLSALAPILQGPEQFRTRLLVPPANITEQWWESRYALSKCAKGASDSIYASISHTIGSSIAVVCSAATGVIGIGIDIERSDRRISSRAASRIQNLVPNSEEPELLRWIRYESAYKASYGNRNLKSLNLDRFETEESTIQTELHSYNEFVVAVAIARENASSP